jgi:hypothetical protein
MRRIGKDQASGRDVAREVHIDFGDVPESPAGNDVDGHGNDDVDHMDHDATPAHHRHELIAGAWDGD